MIGAADPSPITDAPSADRYDVVIVGGAAIGSSIAWFLTQLGSDGTPLVGVGADGEAHRGPVGRT